MTTSLEEEAAEFATNLTITMQAVVGHTCPPFRVQRIGDHFSVSQQPAKGIPLLRDGKPWLVLEAEYQCAWNTARQYMRIDQSAIRLLYGDNPKPLIRYEYAPSNREIGLPAAHLHVHEDATSDLAAMLVEAGDGSRRSRKRQKKFDRGVVPKQSEIHFPVGGDRFRPILEDVLQMLIEEYGIDKTPDWRRVLADARERWRVGQIAAATHDAPDSAASALRELGYTVVAPDDGEPPRRAATLRSI